MNFSKERYRPHPRSKANFLSLLFFGYTFEMFKKGYKNGLKSQDLYIPMEDDRSTVLGDRLQRNWNKQLRKTRPSLFKAIVRTFWLKFLIVGLMNGVHELGIKIYHVVVLKGLLNYFRPQSDSTLDEAIYYASIMTFLNFMALMIWNHFFVESRRIGMHFRVSTCALIYRKALKLKHGCTAEGKLVNLLSNDVTRFDRFVFHIHDLWTATISSIVITILLYSEAGFAGVIGVAAIALILPFEALLGHLSAKYRKETSIKADERVRLIDEVITGIQVIKMYAWEKTFGAIMNSARKAEMKFIKRASYVKATLILLCLNFYILALYASCVTLELTSMAITAAKIFVIMGYYRLFVKAVSVICFGGIGDLAETFVAIDRIEDFLLTEEHKKHVNETKNTEKPRECIYDFKPLVILKDITVKCNSNLCDNTLVNINLNVSEASLVGIIGFSGSGKSSLLHTILGELEIVRGSMKIHGTISYASQEPWIFCGTIRQNIIFGQKFDMVRYERVIHACALEKDLKGFENGDLTLVGDRGASLSGGQKNRINLARAIYRDADIYILDDPLSAVDVHVSNHLYHQCINKFLAGKIRLLVTHEIRYLENADQILNLKNGRDEDGQTNEGKDHCWFPLNETGQNDKAVGLSSFEELNELIELERKTVGSEEMCVSTGSKNGGGYEPKTTLPEADDGLYEATSKGKIKGNLLAKYICTGGNMCLVCSMFFLLVATQIITIGWNHFITYWLDTNDSKEPDGHSTENVMSVYGGIIISISFIVMALQIYLFYILALRSSDKFHIMMCNSVVHAPMRFFDANPRGRILNRFSKDLGLVDEYLPTRVLNALQMMFQVLGGVILILIVHPYALIIISIVGMVLGGLTYIYLSSSKDLQRLDGITKSLVFTHLRATLEGLTTIRALEMEEISMDEFDRHQDRHSSAWFMYITAIGAFGLYLDIASTIFLGTLTFSLLLFEKSIGMTGAEVGLVISTATTITSFIQWTITATTTAADHLMSVERVLEYKNLPIEMQPMAPKSLSPFWPSKGEIIFENIGLKYFDGGPLVLRNISFVIKPREKIGIVGRTGAGKSSLISAFFRLYPVEGTIKIDQEDTKHINLDVLRSKISIIPQDPVLFSGTLRHNLDPLEEYNDEDLYKVIEDVQLRDPSNIFNKLENKVTKRGLNYSVGQRQLICLARAILKKNKIILLDEATANVDPQTAAVIHETIRKKIVDCTVITVTHRLMSIMNSDKVLVMDDGSVSEFDNPHILLQNPGGMFYKMVRESGISEQLQKIAAENYNEKYSLVQEWP